MTDSMPQANSQSRTRVVVIVIVGVILCGLAGLCLTGVGGGLAYLSLATAQAQGTETRWAAQQQATAVAETGTMQAKVMAQTATAVAKSAQASATAEALAQAGTATTLANFDASTATAQARSEASTATAEVRAESTPTLEVAAAVAENWPVSLMDTFDANLHAWPEGAFSDQYGSGSRDFTDGKYHWEASANAGGGLWWVTYTDEKPADFYVALDVAVIQGDANTRYGLVLRHDGTNYDYFDVGDDGQFAFYRWEGGAWTTLINLTQSRAIDKNNVNRLAALVQGKQFTFYINGEQVASATESHLKQGAAGMGFNLHQKTNLAIIEFDNFELRVP